MDYSWTTCWNRLPSQYYVHKRIRQAHTDSLPRTSADTSHTTVITFPSAARRCLVPGVCITWKTQSEDIRSLIMQGLRWQSCLVSLGHGAGSPTHMCLPSLKPEFGAARVRRRKIARIARSLTHAPDTVVSRYRGVPQTRRPAVSAWDFTRQLHIFPAHPPPDVTRNVGISRLRKEPKANQEAKL
jgi:hypothetical protein